MSCRRHEQYTNKEIKSLCESTPDMNKRMNQHGHIKCCKWVPWQHLDESWFALYFHRQRNIKFSFRRHILYKARPLRTKFQKSSCQRHEKSIVGMDPMATHCRKLIVTGIYQANSYQKFVMSYWLAFVPKTLNMLSILKCIIMFWQSDFFGPFRQTKFFCSMELSHLILKYEEKSLVK